MTTSDANDPKTLPGCTFPDVLKAELEQIRKSRKLRDVNTPEKVPLEKDLKGLAFSGGGIRSATFNLGVLQALAEHKLLHEFDYISTVSGGGYIGSWLTAWIHRSHRIGKKIGDIEAELPLQSTAPRDPPEVTKDFPEAPAVRFLRDYSNYLTPRKGIATADTGAFLGGYLRNVVLNLMVVIPLFVALLMAPRVLVLLARDTSVPGWFLLSAAEVLLTLAILVVARNSTAADLRSLSCLTQVLLGSVVPTFLTAYITTCLLYRVALDFDSPFYSIHQCAVMGLKAYLFAWAIAWLFHAPGATGRFGKGTTWLVLVSSAAIAGYAGGALLGGIAHLFRWAIASRQCEAVWPVVGWGIPLVMLAFLLTLVTHLGLMGRDFPDLAREWWARAGGYLMLGTAAWMAVFTLAVYAPWWCERLWQAWQTGSLLGVLAKVGVTSSALLAWLGSVAAGLWAGHSATTGGKDSNPGREIIAKAAPHLFSLGLLLVLSFATHALLTRSLDPAVYWSQAIWKPELNYTLAILGVSLGLSFALSRRIDVNEFSLHHLYRNRLIRCYLGASHLKRAPQCFTGFDPCDDLMLAQLCDPAKNPVHPGPYPILNATLNVVRGGDLALQTRKAKPFIFTPLYSGFDLLVRKDDVHREPAYRPTGQSGCERPEQDGISLGTAMAISGAAASPNMGFHTSSAAAFLMTIFDVRLGWWMGNPRKKETWQKTSPRLGLLYLVKELLGMADDQSSFVYLSDGAHFENLGIYELVRRRCRVILCTDAGHDPSCTFDDLMNAIEKCRVDFGTKIDLDLCGLKDPDDKGIHKSHCAVGTINYGRDYPPGVLIYLKPSLTGDEQGDVLHYHEQHSEFPHESTADQWFDELQFESYRALGYHVMDTYWSGKDRQWPHPTPPLPFTSPENPGERCKEQPKEGDRKA